MNRIRRVVLCIVKTCDRVTQQTAWFFVSTYVYLFLGIVDYFTQINSGRVWLVLAS